MTNIFPKSVKYTLALEDPSVADAAHCFWYVTAQGMERDQQRKSTCITCYTVLHL